MSNTLKVLGQVAPAATTLTDLYSVPVGASATISSVVICNRSASETTFRLAVAVAGASIANAQYLYYDMVLPGNDTFVATVGLTLSAGDVLRIYAGSANVSASVFGLEAN